MLFPESFPVNPDDLCFIEFRPVRFPLCSINTPPHMNKKLHDKSGPEDLDFMPVLYERRTPEWYSGQRNELPVHELLLFFDLDEYDVTRLGPLHGDIGIEALLSRHMAEILPVSRFGNPEYTPLAEQGDDYVSFRYPFNGGRGLSRELRKDPALFSSFESGDAVVSARLIKPLIAERYRQAVSADTEDSIRPTLPKGLSAGLRI